MVVVVPVVELGTVMEGSIVGCDTDDIDRFMAYDFLGKTCFQKRHVSKMVMLGMYTCGGGGVVLPLEMGMVRNIILRNVLLVCVENVCKISYVHSVGIATHSFRQRKR
jgi:hypothetical protein